jgi:hypothetical protein
VYARTVGDRTLTFGVSGMLYRDALVMYDRETSTLWSQVDGKTIKGPLAGRTLTPLASVHATWKEWKALYPSSVVLKKSGTDEFRSAYETYNRSSRLGIFGRRMSNSPLGPKERILGVRYNGAAMAFAMKDVREAGLVQTDVGDVPIMIVVLGPTLPVVAFERRVGDRVFTFGRTGSSTDLEDTDTHSRWRMSDGMAIDGPLTGERLARVTTYPAFWFGWQGFFPRSGVWKK